MIASPLILASLRRAYQLAIASTALTLWVKRCGTYNLMRRYWRRDAATILGIDSVVCWRTARPARRPASVMLLGENCIRWYGKSELCHLPFKARHSGYAALGTAIQMKPPGARSDPMRRNASTGS